MVLKILTKCVSGTEDDSKFASRVLFLCNMQMAYFASEPYKNTLNICFRKAKLFGVPNANIQHSILHRLDHFASQLFIHIPYIKLYTVMI